MNIDSLLNFNPIILIAYFFAVVLIVSNQITIFVGQLHLL